MSFFQKNLAALQNKEPELASYLNNLSDDARITVKDGGIELALDSGKRVFFEKQVIPSNAKKISEKKLFNFAEVIILVGAGVGETLTETLKTADPTAFIILVESNPAFFRKLLEGFDLSREIGDPRVSVAVGENPVEAIMVRLESEFGVFTRPNFRVIKNGLSISCDTEYYEKVDQVLSRQKGMAEANLQAINKLSSLWQTNILSNLESILGNPGISHMFGKMRGIPAIIVAAGPTLDKTCRWIKAAENSMVIICVDTALKTLLSNGITPHFVVSLDALIENWSHLSDVDTSGYTLVVNPVTYPLILSEHKGRMMVTSYTEPMVQWLERFTGDLGVNVTGGSVATSAFDFAERMGCSPIILTGQDLAFTGGRTHSGGGSKEETLYVSAAGPVQQEDLHEDAIDVEIKETIDGNLGHSLVSSAKMITWRNWFEIQIEKRNIHCINATEGGAVIKGAEPSTLQEAFNRYGTVDRGVRDIVEKEKPFQLSSGQDKVWESLNDLVGSAKTIKRYCTLGLKEAADLKKAAEHDGPGQSCDDRVRICNEYTTKIMEEEEFLQVCHWRLESALDTIQRMQSANRSSDERKQMFVTGEAYRIFFKEMYTITKELEKKVARFTAKHSSTNGSRGLAHAQ